MHTGSDNMVWEGARVKVHSLVRAPEHNGVQGRTGAFDASTGRWSVLIEPDGRGLALKPANLTLFCSSAHCRVTLMPPPLRCAKCKAVAYCSKDVGCWAFGLSSNSLEPLVGACTNACDGCIYVFVVHVFISECQKLAWTAGQKRECAPASAPAAAGMKRDTAVRWTASRCDCGRRSRTLTLSKTG